MGSTTEVADGHAASEHEHRSRWPIVAALGAAAIYAGVGLVLVGLDLVPVAIPAAMAGVGLLGFVVGLAGWTYEAFVADYWAAREDRETLYTWGMILFLVSDVATFLAGFIYYAFVRTGTWPPMERPELLGSLVLVNTGLLLLSSGTIHYAHHALERGDRRTFLGALGVTLALGIAFLGGQALEYYELLAGHDSFGIADGVLASAFYGLTGLHGLHVALGVVMLAITFGRALRGHYVEGRDTAVRTVSLYWHFVDVVWVILVIVLYAGS